MKRVAWGFLVVLVVLGLVLGGCPGSQSGSGPSGGSRSYGGSRY